MTCERTSLGREQVRSDFLDRTASAERHRDVELVAQEGQNICHALLAADDEAPDDGTTDLDGPGSERDGLHDIGPATDAAVLRRSVAFR
jgi:ectoine hydroxylase-related dioxygenase (phytanoyl-CoA dioxygenase family)